MRKIRSNLTYANVMVTLLAFIVLGGGAYAAVKLPKNSVGPRQIKANAVSSPKVKDASLLAQDFAPGQLPQGQKGDKGDKGDPGQPGSDAASATAFIGQDAVVPTSANQTVFCAPSGTDTASVDGCLSGNTAANEIYVSQGFPNATMMARDLYVHQKAAAGAGAAIAYTLRVNGGDTAVTCTISDPNTACTSGNATATVVTGSRVALMLQSGATTPNNVGPVQFGWRATTP